MLKPHKMIQNCTKIPENQYVPDTFTLLSWNIYKTNHKFPGIFNYFIRRIDHHYAINFYCLQEACKDSIYMGDNWAFCSAIKA